jgi:DNA-binding GntR family transcriptional regulator
MAKQADRSVKRARGDGARFVYDELRREILTLELAPGVPLDETSLSKRFEMSRSPIREALVRLAAEGLAVTLSNRSTLVAPIDVAGFPRYVEALDFLRRIHMRLAAKNRTEQDLDTMRKAARAFEAAVAEENDLKISSTNRDFHMAIAAAGKNQYLSKSFRELLDQGRRFVHLNFDYLRATSSEMRQGEDHQEMIKAIEQKDAARAEQIGHEHTKAFHDRFVKTLEANYFDDFEIE